MKIAIVDTDALKRSWWFFLLRGLTGMLFGLLTLFFPARSLAALVVVFGAYALLEGMLAIVGAIQRRREDRWWSLLLQGLAGSATALVAFSWPGITARALVYLIAAWALLHGAFEIAAAIRLRKMIRDERLLVLAGVASLALGLLLFLFPGPDSLAFVLWIGAYALVSGVLLAAVALRLRSWMRVLQLDRL